MEAKLGEKLEREDYAVDEEPARPPKWPIVLIGVGGIAGLVRAIHQGDYNSTPLYVFVLLFVTVQMVERSRYGYQNRSLKALATFFLILTIISLILTFVM